MTRSRSSRQGRNHLCWCGSGKKFKKCHEGRERETPLVRGQLRDMLGKPFRENRVCLHMDAPSGCGKIINAHSLQRAGIIGQLVSDDNHVLSFYPIYFEAKGERKINRVGWKRASTFSGFCDVHDNFFSEIEQRAFSATERQRLLVGYRGLCHEIFQRQAAVNSEPSLAATYDRGLLQSEQRYVQQVLAAQAAARKKGSSEMLSLKVAYENILSSERIHGIHSVVLRFSGAPCLASTGTVTPDFDLHGNRLQDLSSNAAPMQGLTFGIVSDANNCAFVATWLAEFHHCDDFARSLLSHKADEIPSILLEWCFAYIENTYFSERWWKSLSQANKNVIAPLATKLMQYGEPLIYSGLKHVDWRLTETIVKLD